MLPESDAHKKLDTVTTDFDVNDEGHVVFCGWDTGEENNPFISSRSGNRAHYLIYTDELGQIIWQKERDETSTACGGHCDGNSLC